MEKVLLNGSWTLEIPGSAYGKVAANVPGSVYHDLLNQLQNGSMRYMLQSLLVAFRHLKFHRGRSLLLVLPQLVP